MSTIDTAARYEAARKEAELRIAFSASH
jgi:hypothetical protein